MPLGRECRAVKSGPAMESLGGAGSVDSETKGIAMPPSCQSSSERVEYRCQCREPGREADSCSEGGTGEQGWERGGMNGKAIVAGI